MRNPRYRQPHGNRRRPVNPFADAVAGRRLAGVESYDRDGVAPFDCCGTAGCGCGCKDGSCGATAGNVPPPTKLDAELWQKTLDRVKAADNGLGKLDSKTVCVIGSWLGGVPEAKLGANIAQDIRREWESLDIFDLLVPALGVGKMVGAAAGIAFKSANGANMDLSDACPGGPPIQDALGRLSARDPALAIDVVALAAGHRLAAVQSIQANYNQHQKEIIGKAASVAMDGATKVMAAAANKAGVMIPGLNGGSMGLWLVGLGAAAAAFLLWKLK